MPSPAANSVLDLEGLLREAEIAHGHLCAGQILGVRMAMLACRRLGIEDPRGKDRKRLVTCVEIDRCATDAIAVVTGCRLGKRALKFRDWGKMAATFLDLNAPLDAPTPSEPAEAPTPNYKAIRIAALESSKARARELFPHIENKNEQQMRAYRELPDADLFSEQWVRVPPPPPRAPRLQILPHRLRPMRRRHQLRPRGRHPLFSRPRPDPLPRLRLPPVPLLPAPRQSMTDRPLPSTPETPMASKPKLPQEPDFSPTRSAPPPLPLGHPAYRAAQPAAYTPPSPAR